MKKILLGATLVASFLTSFAQTQVPNGDFETWDTYSACSYDSLGNFISYEEEYFSTRMCNSIKSIVKSTDSHGCTYALKISTLTITIPHFPNQYISNYILIGNDIEHSENGVVFTGRPTKLTGYYKFTKAGLDTLGISVGTHDENDDQVCFGQFTATASTSTYTKFEIVLDYDQSVTTNPTTLNLFISLGDVNDAADRNSSVLIDDLVFEYDTPTSTTNYTSVSPINVYTANKNITFSENVSDIHVVDMVGTDKMQETTTTKTLNAVSLAAGMYIVTYKYNDAYFSKKVVIE